MRTWTLLLASAAFASAIPPAALGQDYPAKPIRVVVPFAPGGITDNSMRVVAGRLGARLGQQIVIENRPGASGNIGTAVVAQAAPDGYTLVLGYDGTFAINPHIYPKMPFDGLRDFAPVSRLGDATLILVAHPSVPVRTVGELAALARQKPGTLSYGTAGTGTTGHVGIELLRIQLGMDMVHIPYKGGGPALVDVVAGQIPIVSTFIAGAVQYVKQGRLNALGVSSARRDPALPDVPTFSESGAPGYVVTSWVGILAPARTPQAIIDRLHRDIVAVLEEPEIRERYATLGIVPSPNTPEELAALIRADYERWGKVVKEAGIRLE